MARSAVRKKTDPTAVRESEKQRAKRNRDKFRQLITDLNECVSNDSLSTNKCLLTAISILSLEKVHRSSSEEGDKSSPSSSSSSSISPKIKSSSSPSSSSSTSSPFLSSPGSDSSSSPVTPAAGAAAPISSFNGLEFSHLLTARDCFGVGFTDTGIILYTSPNFQNSVGYKESVLGEHLDKIMMRAEDILVKVFENGIVHFMCMVYVVKMCGKDLAPYRFQGKILPCVGGSKMYLGYGEKKSTIIDDPLQLFNISEVIINTDLTYASKRHLYIDTLLGYPSYSNCTTEHVVSEDLVDVCETHKATMKNLQKNFFEHGYAQHVCRLQCHDQTLLYVLCKVFLHVNQEGHTVMVTYSYPFAFSTQTQQSIDEGMRFITSNEQWLALMPPMCSLSQRAAMQQQQEQQLQQQHTPSEDDGPSMLDERSCSSPPPLEPAVSLDDIDTEIHSDEEEENEQKPQIPSSRASNISPPGLLPSNTAMYPSNGGNSQLMLNNVINTDLDEFIRPNTLPGGNLPTSRAVFNEYLSPRASSRSTFPLNRKRTLSGFEESKRIIRSPTLTNFLDLL